MLNLFMADFTALEFISNLARTLFSIVVNMYEMVCCYFPLPLAGLFAALFTCAVAFRVAGRD